MSCSTTPARWLHRAAAHGLFALALFSPHRLPATDVSGAISTNTTWNVAGSPYNLVGTLTVAAGVTLTIEPGVQVVSNQFNFLAVEGALVAQGTSGSPIVFDGSTQSPGWWRGIEVRNAGSAILEYVTVANSGYWNAAGIHKTGTGSLAVRHSTLRHTAGAGLRLYEGSSAVTSESNTYSNNTHGVRLGINTSFADTTSTFTNNSGAQVAADGGTHTANVSWELSSNCAILLLDTQAVGTGATLTLQPGLVVKFAQYMFLAVDGTLHAIGTELKPVHLTDYRDDTVGGDSNNDGALTAAAPGWWRGLEVRNAGSASIEYVTLSYSGYWSAAGIQKTGTGSLAVRHSTLRETAGAGLRLHTGSSMFTSENNTYSNNTHGVRLGINTSFSDTTSTFTNNSAAQVAADGGTHTANVSWELSSNYAILLLDTQAVGTGATLTLQPGLVVKFAQYMFLAVDGTLHAVGTALKPIHLTDYRDDTVGGDSNNNGAATAPAAIWWRGLEVRNAGSATVEYVTLSYSGYWSSAGIFKTGTGSLAIRHSTLRETAGAGLRLNEGSSVFASENNTYSNNTHGVRLGLNTSFSDTTSAFTNNSAAQVLADAGTQTANVTWELSPAFSISLPGTLTIVEGAALTVKPGVTIKFAQYSGLLVYGGLVAEGTAELPVHFTDYRDDTVGGDSNNNAAADAPAPGWWASIQTRIGGSASLAHCTIAYAGYYEQAGIYKTGNGAMSLRHCAISNTAGAGLRMLEGTGVFTTEFNQFIANSAGVRLGNNVSFVDNSSVFNGNSQAPVIADGGTHTVAVTYGLPANYAILVNGSQGVSPTGTLTIQPGTVLKFSRYFGMYIEGTLNATGTPGSPIWFTDQRDDTVGGDTNSDGGLSSPAPDWWIGLQVHNPGTAVLRNVHLRYAGYYDSAGVHKFGDCSLTMENCEVSHVRGHALLLNATSAATDIVRCRFNSSTDGVYVYNTAAAIVLHACQFVGNSEYGVRNQGSGTVDARWAWWGDPTGPYHPTLNATGTGDRVSDGVLFEPWRNTPEISGILSPMRSGTIVAGDSLRFTGSEANDPLAGYLWNFGDGRTSTLRTPGVIAFPQAGSFSVVYSLTKGSDVDSFPDPLALTVVAENGGHPDLSVTSLQVPASAAIGQQMEILYSVLNLGPAALPSSTWKDRVYLSVDEYLDVRDLLLAERETTRALATNASYTDSLAVTLPLLVEGSRHLILSVNDEWSIVERHRLNNEKAAAINVLVPALALAQTLTGNHAAGRTEQYFRITVTGGQNLVIDFGRDVPGLEVRVRFGQLPTLGEFDYRVQNGRLVIPAAAEGDWYVLVSGESLPAAGTFTIKPELVALALASSTPSVQGNSIPLELSLTGAGFVAPLSVDLLKSGGGSYPADTATIESFTAITATFAAGSLPVGTYSVRVTRGGNVATLPSALQIVSGGEPDFHVSITSPGMMGYHQLATLYVDYANRGTAPMPAPLLIVTALQNGTPGALMTLDQSILAQGFWTSAIPKGFSTSIRLVAGGSEPGVLLPGESRRVPVYYAGWLKPWNFSYPPFEFKVVALTADDTRPVPWASLESTLKPPGENDAAWSAVWANFTAGIGGTVGDFVSMLSRNSRYLAKLGCDVRDVNTLATFELLKARGLIGSLSELMATVDLHTDAGALNLIFARSFPRHLTGRHRLGPMGYGWNHCWEIRLDQEADGTVAIVGGNGARRVFQPDSRGGAYFPSRGDHARLTGSAGSFTLTEVDGTARIFDSSGRLTTVRDRNNNTIALTYASGRLSSLAHSDGLAITLTYNGAGLLAKVENSLGDYVNFAYDANQHLTSATDHRGRITAYSYTGAAEGRVAHALTGVTHPGGRVEAFAYDAQGRLASLNNGAGITTFAYSQGDVVATDPEGFTSTASFDHNGMLTRMIDGAGGITSIAYDANLNKTLVRSADGTSMQFTPDRNGGIRAITNQLGNTWTFAPAPFGQYVSITTPTGRKTTYEYDARGNLTRRNLPGGASELFEYDAKGRLTRTTDALGVTETTTYNAFGLPALKLCSDGTSRSFEYDAKNRLVKATNAEGDTVFAYNAAGSVASINYPNGLSLQYTYDSAGRRTEVNDSRGGVTRYVYNAASLVERLNDENNTTLVRYAYDGQARIREKHFSNGARTVYERNARGQITRQTTRSSLDQVLAGFQIAYDITGLPTAYDTPEGSSVFVRDAAGHLAGVDFMPTTGPAVITTYMRDADGRLASMSVDGALTSFQADARGLFTAIGSASMTYNASGNLLTKSDGGSTFTYDHDGLGRLVEMETGGDHYQMRYDALGTPLGLTAPGLTVNYLYDLLGGALLVGEYSPNGDPVRTYRHGVDLAVVKDGGTGYHPEFDPLRGDTVLAMQTGSVPLSQRVEKLTASAASTLFVPPYGYGDPLLPEPRFYGITLDGYVTLASEAQDLGQQAYMWGVEQGGVDQWVGGLIRDSNFGMATGIIGLGGPLNDINNWLGDATKIAVVIQDPPDFVRHGVDFLTSDGLGATLNVLGIVAGGIEVIDGISETWSDNRSVDVLDVLNPFGGLDEGTTKIRHGLAGTAATLLGMAAAGTAAAPVVAAAGIIAFISDNTGGLQESFWIWWDGLDVTGERLRGSAFSGSLDPNQKVGVRGVGAANYVSRQARLNYRVDFENRADATAPAQVVTIRDKLPAGVDWSTFELLEVGFGDLNIPIEPGSRSFETVVNYGYKDAQYDFQIDVHISVTFEDGEIFAVFSSIDPATGLPPPVQIGFLPPEPHKVAGTTQPGEGRGQGHLSFGVSPKTDLPDGTEIRNVADIQFDFSFEIATNQVDPLDASKGVDANKEALHTIDAAVPTSNITSLPANTTNPTFNVSWSGTDTGSGLAGFDIYVKTNAGAWTLWLDNTVATSAQWQGAYGNTYGFYVVARDAAGLAQAAPTAGTPPATQTAVSPGPHITVHPTNRTAVIGSDVTFSVTATGQTPLSYQWRRNGANVPGATGSTLTVTDVQPGAGANYTVVVSNGAGSVTSNAATLALDTTPRLINVSCLASAGAGDSTLVAGFYINGGGNKELLIRGVGPTLAAAPFNRPGMVVDPQISVYDGNGTLIASNNDWDAALAPDFSRMGAFGLVAGSKDAALKIVLAGNNRYTVHLVNIGANADGLIEVYDFSRDNATRLSNVSCRIAMKAHETVILGTSLIANPVPVLARAIGPGLADYGIPLADTLPDPDVRVYSGSTEIAFNEDWSASLAPFFNSAGAFPLPAGSKDAATRVTFTQGGLTIHATGKGQTGIAIIELFESQ